MEEKVTLIVKATINNENIESFNNYVQKLMELYRRANVQRIAQYAISETYLGHDTPTFIAIFEFPDKGSFSSIYESTDYKTTMIPLREKGFKNLEVFLS